MIFSFYGEAPFVIIEYLGFTPSQYGTIGLCIASATVIASGISFRLNQSRPPQEIISLGAAIALFGSTIFLMSSWIFESFGVTIATLVLGVTALIVVFVGIGLIIPNSLTLALQPYAATARGSAGSIFGGLYYLGIALATLAMSWLHNGTIWPLPLFFLVLSLTLVWSSSHLTQCRSIEV